MFYKTRMRRLLRRMIVAAAPPGLRPDPHETARRALLFERAAIALGLTWHGLSPAQAALLVVHVARVLSGLGPAQAQRLAAAAQSFAEAEGLAAFSAAIERDIRRIEHLGALRHRGRPEPRPGGASPPILA